MSVFPVALQLYSVRDAASENTEAVLKQIKSFGYDGVEFAGFYGNTPAELAKKVALSGLEPVSAHVAITELRADINKVINDYKTLGCRHIAVPWLGEDERPGAIGFPRVIEELNRFGEILLDAGITLSYHNHDFEFVRVGSEYGFDLIYSSVPAELLKVEQDTCWVSVAGESPVAYIEKYAGRCPLLHLKDYVGKKSNNMYKLIGVNENEKSEDSEAFELRPLGCGVQDFKAIIAAAEKSGVEWLIVEQDEPSMNKSAVECAQISREYLKSIGY